MTLSRAGMAVTLLLAIAALVYALMIAESVGPGESPVLSDFESERFDRGPAGSQPVRDPTALAEREKVAPDSSGLESARSGPEAYRRALGSLTGRIVESDGAPVPALPLELYGLGFADLSPDIASMFRGPTPSVHTLRGQALTCADGRFRFEGIFPGSIHVLGIDLRGLRVSVRFIDRMPNPGENVDLGDLSLEPFAALTGIVLDRDGEPVAGARVRVSNFPARIFQMGAAELRPDSAVLTHRRRSKQWELLELPGWISDLIERLPVPETTTAEDGRFTFKAIPTGMASILVDKVGFVTKVHGPVPTGEEGGGRDVGSIRIDEGQALRGVVLDHRQRPVVGAELRIGRKITLAPLALLRPAGVSGEDGRFVIAALADGPHLLAARGPGQLDWLVLSDILPGIDTPTLRLLPAHDLTVRVVDGAGQPIENAELMLGLGSDPAKVRVIAPVIAPPIPLAGRMTRLEDGSLLIERLGARTYDLFVRADRFATLRLPVDLTGGPATVQVALEEECLTRIRIMTANSGEPVEWARVSAYRGGDWQRRSRVPTSSARSDADGEVVLSGLRDGRYRLQVEHPGFATSVLRLELPSELLVVELKRGGRLLGRIHAGGQPLAEARFVVAEGRHDLLRFSVTDSKGRFAFEALPTGTLRVVVYRRFAHESPNDYAGEVLENLRPQKRVSAEIVEGQTTQVEIDLHSAGVEGPTARLRGQVLVNGRPGAGWSVTVYPGESWGNRKTTRTDAAGRFDFGLVPAGGARVQIERAGDFHRGPYWQGGYQIRNVELAANEARELLFALETGRLRGRVIGDLGGAGVGGAQVSISSIDPSRAREQDAAWTLLTTLAEPSGEFAFHDVLAGSYRVAVEAEGYALTTVGPVAVPVNGEPPSLEIRLIRGSQVSGVVRLPDGLETSYFYLWLNEQGSNAFSATTAPDRATGRFTLEHVPPGTYRLNVAADGGPYLPQELEVPQGGLKDLHIELKRAAPDRQIRDG